VKKFGQHGGKMKRLYKFFDWGFYLLGVALSGTTLHEIYHFIHCGGSFVSGLAYLNNHWEVGVTWCQRVGNEGEIVPTTLEVLFYIFFIWVKIKHK